MNKETSENQALIDFVKANCHPPEQRALKHDGLEIPYLVKQDGSVTSLAHLVDNERERPRRRQGTANFEDQTSFEEHTNRFKSEASTLWARRGDGMKPSISSVLDYHEPGAEGKPAFCKHRGVFDFPLSDEWQAWFGGADKEMTQAVFSEFIEKRLNNVVNADKAPAALLERLAVLELRLAAPTQLLQLSRGMRVHVASEIHESANLSSGEGELTFKIEHTDSAGQKLRIPQAFVIHIPIFRGGESIALAVFLRYRIGTNKRPTWFYEIFEADRAFDEAFLFECEEAKTATGLPLFFGAPES